MPLNFVTYTRISTPGQEGGWSPITQLANCQEFGLSQGWKAYKKEPHIHDTHTGVDYEQRPGIQQILLLVRAGLVQRVIINDIDRAGRDRHVLERLVEDIYAVKGCRPVIALDNREFATAREFLQEYHFQIAVAEWQRNKIIIETRRGLKTAFKAGAYLTSPPFGYIRDKSKRKIDGINVTITTLKIDPIDADLVVKGLEFFSEGIGYRKSAIKLNFYNLEKNPDKRRSFITTSISRMVENVDVYLGLPYTIKREIQKEVFTQTQQHPPYYHSGVSR